MLTSTFHSAAIAAEAARIARLAAEAAERLANQIIAAAKAIGKLTPPSQ